jgi:ATP-dependent Clp protease ATP-binding subunit ClpA
VIDEAGAAQRILPKSKQKKTIGATRSRRSSPRSRASRRPRVSDDRGKLKSLDRDLKSVVFGQDPAIDALAAAIKMARSGLGKPDKPIGSFLFSGPTGVGKTEVAKQLAYILGIELIRFDMSEYMERHAVSRLIGAPPGYVGFDQGGLLTEAVTKKPHCVLLLDEIEKAHPDVFNVLLQVMDHGTLTDNNGRKADFRNVIIIMTTNAGAETMNKATIGFTTSASRATRWPTSSACSRPSSATGWTPSSASKALDEDIILRVVDKFLLQLESQLGEKKVEVTFTDALRKHLAKKGFDPLMGARPMQRLIQDTIRRALADELLFGRLVDGGRLTVDVDDEGEVQLDIQPPRKSDKPGTDCTAGATRTGRSTSDVPGRAGVPASAPTGHRESRGAAVRVPRGAVAMRATKRSCRQQIHDFAASCRDPQHAGSGGGVVAVPVAQDPTLHSVAQVMQARAMRVTVDQCGGPARSEQLARGIAVNVEPWRLRIGRATGLVGHAGVAHDPRL